MPPREGAFARSQPRQNLPGRRKPLQDLASNPENAKQTVTRREEKIHSA